MKHLAKKEGIRMDAFSDFVKPGLFSDAQFFDDGTITSNIVRD